MECGRKKITCCTFISTHFFMMCLMEVEQQQKKKKKEHEQLQFVLQPVHLFQVGKITTCSMHYRHYIFFHVHRHFFPVGFYTEKEILRLHNMQVYKLVIKKFQDKPPRKVGEERRNSYGRKNICIFQAFHICFHQTLVKAKKWKL